MSAARKVLAMLRIVEDVVMCASLAVIVVLVTVQVIARYVFRGGFLWSDELVGFLLVTISMIGSAIAYRERLHTSLDFFFNKARGAVRLVMRVVIELCSVVFLVALIYSGTRLAAGSMNQRTFTIDMPIGAVYSLIPIGAALLLLEVVVRNIDDLSRAAAHRKD